MISIAILLFFFYNGVYIFSQFNKVQPFGYIGGRIDRNEYIQSFRSEHRCIRYTNENTALRSKILGVFMGNRSYYFNREIRFNFYIIINYLKASSSDESLYRKLKADDFTHLFIRFDLFRKWAADQLNSDEIAVLNQFLKNFAIPLCSDFGFGLYELRDLKKAPV